jgi:ATP-binding cassette subfamily B (MDR/TAP) protein 1
MKNHDPTSDPSIRSTIHSASSSTLDIKNDTNISETTSIHEIPNTHTAPVPSMKLLFSFLTPRRKLVLLTPAILSSVATGAIAPLMTYAVGQSFNAFAAFPLTRNPPQSAKDALLHGVGVAAIELVALSISALVMSSITSSLWISTGEHNVVELRRLVYQSVVNKEMSWFDLRMGVDGSAPAGHVQDTSEDSPVGAGGLMAKFARLADFLIHLSLQS